MEYYEIKKIRDWQGVELAVEEYCELMYKSYRDIDISTAKERLLSECNYYQRKSYHSCHPLDMHIRKGDIVYVDFGRAYLLESGYQHFALVINIYHAKAFVIPMTSNFNSYRSAYDPLENPRGVSHLYRMGKLPGLNKYSVAFINDGKYINTARIIEIKGHIEPTSELFKSIYKHFLMTLENNNEEDYDYESEFKWTK